MNVNPCFLCGAARKILCMRGSRAIMTGGKEAIYLKRILSIQDVSCLGKCSLTVALPIISAMGTECAIIPTAVLSTHTMFSGFTFHDLSGEIAPVTEHWKREGFGFDAIYTGYLGTFEQIDLVARAMEELKGEKLIIVDPAMGDNGKLYPSFDEAYAKKMATLCAKADMILPNITEACYLTGMEYREEYDEAYIRSLLLALAELGAETPILSSVCLEPGKTGVMGYDSCGDSFWYYGHKKHERSYHGTGDLFASTLVGGLMRGRDWKDAARLAADFTAECIAVTMGHGKFECYAVDFEECIPWLVSNM